MSPVAVSKTALRCHHCSREVAETVHTRSSYRVGYYALHTGDVEPMTLPRVDDSTPPTTALKLLRAVEIVTCADCYRDAQVRQERDALFRSEGVAGLAQEEAS